MDTYEVVCKKDKGWKFVVVRARRLLCVGAGKESVRRLIGVALLCLSDLPVSRHQKHIGRIILWIIIYRHTIFWGSNAASTWIVLMF